jgi:glycosyltransferase involved in cell wall biosynthesis
MNNLNVGGAEKALVSLLQVFDYEKYNVDLLLLKKEGIFLQQIPKEVNLLPEPRNYHYFDSSFINAIKTLNPKLIYNRWKFVKQMQKGKSPAEAEQLAWFSLRNVLESLKKEYDAAIGYLEKTPNYFVVDKVSAKKKIGFIHNDYNKLRLDKNIDKPYFDKLNYIATVSQECAEVLVNEFPQNSSKIKLIYNVVSSKLIYTLSEQSIENLKHNAIVSVGRLHPQKGFDLAVKAAAILKKKNVDFHWYIIGEGSERQNLEQMIKEHRLQDNFTLSGLKENPYPYIKQAKIFVQPSRYEGKSIAIDEAKTLAKPIIITDFTTAKDQIENGVNGLICEMNPEALAASVENLLKDENLREKLSRNLAKEDFSTEKEIEKIYKLLS